MGSDTILIRDGSTIGVHGFDNKQHVHVDIDKVAPISINQVQKIAPVAAHIKEVNHIDPISVEALNVSEVRNIEPLKIEKFNVTNLPTVNMTLRQLPPLDMNIRKLPPLSVGMHQDFHVPSDYTVSGRILGIEFFRVHLDGCTNILPKERFRREQERTTNRSFPVPATAGNPAIPSIHEKKTLNVSHVSSCGHSVYSADGLSHNQHTHFYGNKTAQASHTANKGGISYGMPHANFFISGLKPREGFAADFEESSISSGE